MRGRGRPCYMYVSMWIRSREVQRGWREGKEQVGLPKECRCGRLSGVGQCQEEAIGQGEIDVETLQSRGRS